MLRTNGKDSERIIKRRPDVIYLHEELVARKEAMHLGNRIKGTTRGSVVHTTAFRDRPS